MTEPLSSTPAIDPVESDATPAVLPDFESNRRDFLKAAGAAAVTISSAPFVHSDDKSGKRPVKIGVEGHMYECHHNWGQLPDHIKWYETHGVAVSSEGLVYVTHRGLKQMDTVVVFDAKGKFVRSFGKEYAGGGHGIDIRTQPQGGEFLYLTNNKPHSKIVITDIYGGKAFEMQHPEASGRYTNVGQFNPTNVAFGPKGTYYVADGYGSNLIHQYNERNEWMKTWGGTGTEIGQFKTPHGIWLDNRPGRKPQLVVADRANARLQYFTLDGQPLPDQVVKDVSFPAHFDLRGPHMLVADLHARISIFDKDNKLVVHLGYDPMWTEKVLDGFRMRNQPQSWEDGKFIHPHDACFDKFGNIYVAEWVPGGRVSFLKKVG